MSKSIIGGIIFLIALCVFLSIMEKKEWDAFKTSHACKITAHISGDIFNTVGIGSNGQATVGIGSTPDKTGWTCNDGVTYFR